LELLHLTVLEADFAVEFLETGQVRGLLSIYTILGYGIKILFSWVAAPWALAW
jgi:hypothetical protein